MITGSGQGKAQYFKKFFHNFRIIGSGVLAEASDIKHL